MANPFFTNVMKALGAFDREPQKKKPDGQKRDRPDASKPAKPPAGREPGA